MVLQVLLQDLHVVLTLLEIVFVELNDQEFKIINQKDESILMLKKVLISHPLYKCLDFDEASTISLTQHVILLTQIHSLLELQEAN